MSQKISSKISHSQLLYAMVALMIATPLFYIVSKKLYMHDLVHVLIRKEERFTTHVLPTFKLSDIKQWNDINQDEKIYANKNLIRDTVFTIVYDHLLVKGENVYLELNSPIVIEKIPYTYAVRLNLAETKYFILNAALLFLALGIIVFMGLIISISVVSGKIGKELDKMLYQIGHFFLTKDTLPQFPKDGIEELVRIGEILGERMRLNLDIHLSQQEFVENAAHELQTPLAVIKAKLDMLIQDSSIEKKHLKVLISLSDHLSRMNRLNRNLLLLSKMDHDVYHEKEVILLNDLVEKQLDFFIEQALSKRIVLRLQLETEVKISANLILTEVLIRNFFMNAIRHNVEDGKILVVLAGKTLSFRNTGNNMPLNADKLFDRFYKDNASQKGTGLGLSIVKKIAEINHWSIEYKYEKNFHCFYIHF